jgi:apolipoprotein N-acyltransferase
MDGENQKTRRFASGVGYLLVVGLCAIFIVWIVARMTRTEAADYLVIRMAAALAAAVLVLLAAMSLRRRRGRSQG